ncbi:uncharacterized protein LOC127612065 [Hippocampus zosterae]|uniref:uncharacterized protein LOC127612065 n=1 Tax=Hippocampus zosterae TaxID=109293 RepID=UPI00223DACA9|nr:uncharacterized protein LOC127612065 [Hippocampus zosterae]
MKDFSLSSLSRGCGRVIKGNASEHGRLDVCFTPQDYYIWKSHDALLHLTNSGSLLRSDESTIPKTYSTRRGPLVLYSRDLVTLRTVSQVSDRRRRVTSHHMQEVDHRSDALLLQQQNNQVTLRFASPNLPPLPNIHRASVSRLYATQEHHDPKLHGDPQETNSLLEYPPEDENEMQGSDQRVQLDLVLDLQTCTDHITLEEPQLQVDVSHADRSQQNMTTDLTLVLSPQDAAAVTRGSVIMVNSQTSVTRMNNRRENQSHEEQELNTSSGLLLPPLRAEPPVTPESYYHHPLAMGREGPNIEEVHHVQHLPPIEDHHVTMRLVGGTRRRDTDSAIGPELRCQKGSRHRPLFLPLLLSDKKHGDKTLS